MLVGVVDWIHGFLDVPAEDADAAGAFWSAVTGWPLAAPWADNPEFRSLEPSEGSAYLHVQRIGGPARVHLDVMSDDVPADVAAHVALGATTGTRRRWWQVMSSPAGFPYCLVEARKRRRVPPPAHWPGGRRSRVDRLCLDVPAADFAREVEFWAATTGWPAAEASYQEYRGILAPPSSPMGLLVQRLGAEDAGAVRAHLDLATDDVAAEVARVRALGAEPVDATHPWAVLRDPAGLPFCVVPRLPA